MFLKVNILSALGACHVTVIGWMIDKYKFENATHCHDFDTTILGLLILVAPIQKILLKTFCQLP